MATDIQIKTVLRRLEQAHPAHFFRCVDEVQAGIGAALRLIYESEEPVTAGRISDELGVSTARVAVLIKKMAAKGLVTREQGEKDARVTIVRLTESGIIIVEEIRDNIYRQIGKVIDTVGEERLAEFISIAEEIKAVITPPKIDF